MLPKIKYLLLTLFGFLLLASPVYAASSDSSSTGQKEKAQIQTRACQVKQQVIRTRMENLVRLSSTVMDVFDGIHNRADVFYQTHVASNGRSVSNYNELIQEVKQKQDDANTALETAKIDSNKFSCESDNPKSSLMNFRKDMQDVKTALKDYRTSIKNFIVAVKKANNAIPTAVPTGMMEK